jgi:hypothetical protein
VRGGDPADKPGRECQGDMTGQRPAQHPPSPTQRSSPCPCPQNASPLAPRAATSSYSRKKTATSRAGSEGRFSRG